MTEGKQRNVVEPSRTHIPTGKKKKAAGGGEEHSRRSRSRGRSGEEGGKLNRQLFKTKKKVNTQPNRGKGRMRNEVKNGLSNHNQRSKQLWDGAEIRGGGGGGAEGGKRVHQKAQRGIGVATGKGGKSMRHNRRETKKAALAKSTWHFVNRIRTQLKDQGKKKKKTQFDKERVWCTKGQGQESEPLHEARAERSRQNAK